MNPVRSMNEKVTMSAATMPGMLREVPVAERFNVASHLAAAVVQPVLVPILAWRVLDRAGATAALGCLVFGIGMTVAYLASAAFHAACGRERERRRRWDRCGIFVAVASYHTATVLIGTTSAPGLVLLALIWALAARAARQELTPGSASPRRSVLPYLVLGWGGMLAWGAVASALTLAGFVWLVLSALAASLGVFALQCDRLPRHHELWHVMVMAGNACVLLSWVHGL